jgi:hypothetical protein
MGPKIQDCIGQKLETWPGLELDCEKTRIVNLRGSEKAALANTSFTTTGSGSSPVGSLR